VSTNEGRITALKLLQIPFSHNSIKVRRVLALKGLSYEHEDVNPAFRKRLIQVSGQPLTPVLVDGARVISDSTAILLYLESAYPDPPLLPPDKEQRAECLLLEDWADGAFMALTRRLAYWSLITSEASLGDLFFPRAPALFRRLSGPVGAAILRRRFGLSSKQNRLDEAEVRRLASLAVHRLAARPFLVGDRITLADVTLAAMSMPLQFASPAVREDSAVIRLLAWDQQILDDEFTPLDPSRLVN
jgi:glutathione S-transferase